MLRTSFVTALAVGAGALFTASCGGGDPSATGGAGGATTTTTSSTSSTVTTSSTSSTITTSSSATGGTGGKSFCAFATDIVFGDYLPGDLVTAGQQDLYRFTGKKGQVIEIDVDAQGPDHDFDPDYIDAVVTLFDADGNQLAQNDNPIEYSTEDSRLYTILPADGEYCIRVADCWTVIANPTQSCAAPKDKLDTSYAIYLYEFVDEFGDANTSEVEAGDDPATATAIDYMLSNSGYYITTLWGTFRDQDDIDVWSFTLPTDLDPAPPSDVRTIGYFYLMTSGVNGSGSTADTGKISVADASAPGVVLAAVDASKNPRFRPRLDLGKPYLLFVTRPTGATGTNDFYFVRHSPGWGNPLEIETKGVGPVTGVNDTPATAEPLVIDTLDGYIEGDLSMSAADVDHFIATVPPGAVTVDASCAAARYGSGLRDFKVSLLKTDGTPLAPGASDVDSETHSPRVTGIPVGSETAVIMKLEAASQDPMVSESFYLCGLHFQ